MRVLTQENEAPVLQKSEEAHVRRICFVCTGNTCRSPMAEAVARHLLLTRKPSVATEVFSAGLYANSGEPISRQAIAALEEAEISPDQTRDYHMHTAHNLGAEEAERYDLLVGMTGSHAMELMMRFPMLAQRITCMPTPISDPYGGDLDTYRACLAEIRAGVQTLLYAEE